MAKKIRQINQNKPDIIDGFDGFLELFETEEDAIKFIVSHTYFFHPKVVNAQISEFKNNPPKVVRKASGEKYFTEDGEEITDTTSKSLHKLGTVYVDGIGIIVDRDGNKKVREEIKKYTNHIVSEGRNRSTMKNFIITHIWGRTNDPNFFSSMWNYCITPLYAASLTDKDDSDCFCRQLKNLFKAIAIKLYDPNKNMNEIKPPVKVSIGSKLDTDNDPEKWAEELINSSEINLINQDGSICNTSQPSNGKLEFTITERISTIIKGKLKKTLCGLTNEQIVKELQEIKYCKENFGLSYAVLLPKNGKDRRPKHYYKEPISIQGTDYYLCQEWKTYHKEKLNKWITDHA